MQNNIITPPTPAYSNPPITPEFFKPKKFFILNITLGKTTIVQTTIDVDYVVGQLVRLIIPKHNGSRQLNEKLGYVISIPSANQVEIDIDSSINIDDFISSLAPNQPQILAIGDINSGQINSYGRVNLNLHIPGSFINIS